MVKTIYTIVYYLLSPLMCVRWFFKSLRPLQYREPFLQRFGFVATHSNVDIWFHAVSMGETSGAISIIKKLLQEDPSLNIIVTTTTPTGARLLKQGLADRVTHYYSPCDLPGTIKRFIKRVSPKMVVIMETELWPNWLAHVHAKKIPLVLANARLSASSAKKYAMFPKTSQSLFSHISSILAVNSADAERFKAIGIEQDKVQVTGNIKFDAGFPVADANAYFPYWDNNFTWIAASTHQGEDEQLIEAQQKLMEQIPTAKLILVPRHPERFSAVASLLTSMRVPFVKRSAPDSWQEDAQVLLGDSMGELLLAYQKSDVAFIGGSFVDVGGHNAIEAAYYSKPILTGPNYHNFQYLFDSLCAEQAAEVVSDSEQLAEKLILLAQDSDEAMQMGLRAKAFVDNNKGALDKVVNTIQSTLTKCKN